MTDIGTLARSIDQRKIERARNTSIEAKLLAGPRLFKLSCEAIKAGLRLDYPEATDAEIHSLLIKRVYNR